MPERGSRVAIGITAGILAGLAGTAAMNAFWATEAKITHRKRNPDESSTTRIAADLLRRFGASAPARTARRTGGRVVHWGYGAAWGAIAGGLGSVGVRLDIGGGLPLGAALWAAGDEWALYKLGYAKHPREYPMRSHLESLAAHLAYGAGLWAALAAERKLGHSLASVRIAKAA